MFAEWIILLLNRDGETSGTEGGGSGGRSIAHHLGHGYPDYFICHTQTGGTVHRIDAGYADRNLCVAEGISREECLRPASGGHQI